MKLTREIRELSDGLKAAFEGSNVTNRVRDFEGWTARASREDDADQGYDHTRTVEEYYDLCTGFMVWGGENPCTSRRCRPARVWRTPRSGCRDS